MTNRLADDLDLAGQVQRLLFPKSSPVCDWNCIGVKNRMARSLGGDYLTSSPCRTTARSSSSAM